MSVYYKGNRVTSEGVTNYNQLDGKPTINGQLVQGNIIVDSIVEVSVLPAIPNPKVLYKLGDTLNWYSGTEWRPVDREQVSMTLNGGHTTVTDTDVNIYAPTTSGTAGQVLVSKGANQAPEWKAAASGGQTSWYGTCASDGALQAKEATCDGFELVVGATIAVYFTNANTITAPTLNVNNTGAKQIKCGEENMDANIAWAAGQVVTLVYDGTYWRFQSIDRPPVTYGACTTAVGTTAKEVAIPGFKLMKGAVVYVSFTYPHISGTAATLNVNATGAKTIRRWGQNITTNNGTSWMANDLVGLVYDGTYWQIIDSSNVPVGTITMFGGANVPAGWILCNGSNINRTTYNKLYAVIGTTFGAGDGSTTFTLPDFRQRFPQGAGNGSLKGATPSLGTKTAPGIPDVYGTWKVEPISHTDTTRAGAISISGGTTKMNGFAGGSAWGQGVGEQKFTFRASSGEVPSTSSTSVSNNVFGKSATVQPASTAVNFIIRWA